MSDDIHTPAELPATEPASTETTSIKGFDSKMMCSGHLFEFGQTYEVKGAIVACRKGFHACPTDGHPLSVFGYYPPAGARYAEVIQSGASSRDGDKLASAKITIGVEITLHELITRAAKWVFDRADWKNGPVATEDNEGATASGYQGAATASGDQGAATASGYQGAATASGYQGVALSSGREAKARATKTSAICLVHRNDDGEIVHIRASKVGENGVKANTWYSLSANGEFVEIEE